MSKKTRAVVQRHKRGAGEKMVHVVVTPSMPMPGVTQPSALSPAPPSSSLSPAAPPELSPSSTGTNANSPAYQERSPSRAAPPSAYILVEQQGRVTAKVELNRPAFTVGRHSSCDIRMINQRVSRLHARLYQDNDTWVIEDANSINGIAYQGQRVRRVMLKHGDRVYLAPDAALIYEVSMKY
ncbi:MAG TPA: FHA domain-containing protein [Ktedonobacteraceae bacterium]